MAAVAMSKNFPWFYYWAWNIAQGKTQKAGPAELTLVANNKDFFPCFSLATEQKKGHKLTQDVYTLGSQ